MVRSRDAPNLVVKYVGEAYDEVSEFLDKWTSSSSICLNFKLEQAINEPIGGRIKRITRRRSRGGSTSRRRSRSRLNPDLTSEEDLDESADLESTPPEDPKGLPLRLEIDKDKHFVTRMYACFECESLVYIINKKRALQQIRQNLRSLLENCRQVPTTSSDVKDEANFTPVRLYTQNIVLTYKVLYAGFNIDQRTLFRCFEWHSFDVAWWMINNCPSRGLNNCNSSLSLVARTQWAARYHHFLHPSDPRTRQRRRSNVAILDQELVPEVDENRLGRSLDEFQRLKDIVKSGKTAILKPLIDELLAEIDRREQMKAYRESETVSRLVLAQVMVHGIGLNMQSMRDELNLYQDLSEQLSDIARRCYAKSDISLTNIRHVARVLYDDLDLKKHLLNHSTVCDITKNPTDSEVLKILSQYHPFPRLVQDFRRIGKALEALQSANTYARYNSELDMMRVFGKCDFWLSTGRVSMTDPDLFLINRNFTVTIPEHGNRPREIVECAPRRCFVPVPGWVFISADYSQLELRLLAHFSDDENLLEILNRDLDSDEDFDVFRTLASKIYRKPIDKVTGENRQHAKQISYGIIYGMGNTRLANHLGVDVEQAEVFRQDFFNAFPRIQTFAEQLVEDCEKNGYVESLMGRRRTIFGIDSEHSFDRSKAKRVSINTRIQSSASDIIKSAMHLVNQKLLNEFPNTVRLCLEMHDELIFEVDPKVDETFSNMLKQTMESLSSVEDLKVKLLVNLKKGANWSNMKKF